MTFRSASDNVLGVGGISCELKYDLSTMIQAHEHMYFYVLCVKCSHTGSTDMPIGEFTRYSHGQKLSAGMGNKRQKTRREPSRDSSPTRCADASIGKIPGKHGPKPHL